MFTREDLLKSSEYWTEIIQNKIFNDLMEYIEDNNISNKQLGEILGLSKGRISQILSGKYLNFKIDSLVKLCLSINKIPDFHLEDIKEYIEKDLEETESIIFKSIPEKRILLENLQKYKPSGKTGYIQINPSAVFSIIKNTDTPETPTYYLKTA